MDRLPPIHPSWQAGHKLPPPPPPPPSPSHNLRCCLVTPYYAHPQRQPLHPLHRPRHRHGSPTSSPPASLHELHECPAPAHFWCRTFSRRYKSTFRTAPSPRERPLLARFPCTRRATRCRLDCIRGPKERRQARHPLSLLPTASSRTLFLRPVWRATSSCVAMGCAANTRPAADVATAAATTTRSHQHAGYIRRWRVGCQLRLGGPYSCACPSRTGQYLGNHPGCGCGPATGCPLQYHSGVGIYPCCSTCARARSFWVVWWDWGWGGTGSAAEEGRYVRGSMGWLQVDFCAQVMG